jgi:uncharacterized damage-inducible protein DinB
MTPELEPIWQQFAETCSALRQTLAEVPDDRINWQPGPAANSVARIIQHIARGNILYSQMMRGDENGPRRAVEAEPDRARLLDILDESEQIVRQTFDAMTPETLRQMRADDWNPLGPDVAGPLDALWFALQTVRHAAYHLGQMNVYLLLLEGTPDGRAH